MAAMQDQKPEAPLAVARKRQMEMGQMQVVTMPGQGGAEVKSLLKLTPQGLVRNWMCAVRLSEEKGEVYRMRGAPIITAAGYDRCNLFAGITFVCPPVVAGEDGTDRPNPYLHRSKSTGVEWVRVRQVGVGRNPQANLVAHDLTLNYDLSMYWAQDILSKWSGRKSDACKSWGTLENIKADGQYESIYPRQKVIALPDGFALIVDLTHLDVVACVLEHINRQKFAERNAITICRRNILKRHFAAAKLDNSLTVNIVGWPQIDRDLDELREVVSKADAGKVTLGGEAVIVERNVETPDRDEADAVLSGDVHEDMTGDDDDEPAAGVDVAEPSIAEKDAYQDAVCTGKPPLFPGESPPPPADPDPEFAELIKQVGPEDAFKALGAAGIDPDAPWGPDTLTFAKATLKQVLKHRTRKDAGHATDQKAGTGQVQGNLLNG